METSETVQMNTDSEIASKLKTIYIQSQGKDIETLTDHWCLTWSDVCEILFEKPKESSSQ